MLVVPNTAVGLPDGLCEAQDSWDGAASVSAYVLNAVLKTRSALPRVLIYPVWAS